MDAYDIFKKLSRGTKLIRERKDKEPKKENSTVKTETNEECEEKFKTETSVPTESTITLLNSLNKSDEFKSKKRKRDNSQNDDRKQKLLKIEEVNHYRNLNKINVVGKHIPDPARTFDDFEVAADIIENLKKSGYEEPTPVQKQAVPIMLQGRHLLACAPTGSGKTAAFLVPIINELKGPQKQGFRALILCPTRELAKQTQRECWRLAGERGFHIHIISKINRALTQYGPKSSQKFDILITTPNRLCFLLKQDPPAISLANVQWLVIDEADKLFETGDRGFREQLDEILAACTSETRKIAMFSATYTPTVAKWCVHNMKSLIRITIGHRNTATDLVDQELLFVGNEQGKLLAIRDLVKQGLNPPVLVFVQSKDRAQQLFNELIYDGINVDVIHADRTQLQRDNTVKSFREGRTWVLICTELMARGIDFKGVNLVINYDFPTSVISYVHRVGRAGRAGRRGRAITFFTLGDSVNLRNIAHVLKESGSEVPEYMLTMKKRSKRDRKQLEKSAPKRDHINTRPKYEIMKEMRRKKRREGNEKKLKALSEGVKLPKKKQRNTTKKDALEATVNPKKGKKTKSKASKLKKKSV